MVIAGALALGLMWALTACVGPMSEMQLGARERFSRQYRCPEESVRVEELGTGAYRTSGCRRSAIYQCTLVMAMDDSVHCQQERQ